jgi:hypothetical protein
MLNCKLNPLSAQVRCGTAPGSFLASSALCPRVETFENAVVISIVELCLGGFERVRLAGCCVVLPYCCAARRSVVQQGGVGRVPVRLFFTTWRLSTLSLDSVHEFMVLFRLCGGPDGRRACVGMVRCYALHIQAKQLLCSGPLV